MSLSRDWTWVGTRWEVGCRRDLPQGLKLKKGRRRVLRRLCRLRKDETRAACAQQRLPVPCWIYPDQLCRI